MLAVTGGKGGVGKTTTALAVATLHARAGRSPVVVDADVDVPDLARLAAVPDGGLDTVAHGGSLDSGPAAAGVTVLGATAETTTDDLRTVLDRLSDAPRPVVVDCPAGVGAPHGLALRAATDSVLVTRPTSRAINDALRTAVLARRLDAPPRTLAVTAARRVPDGLGTAGLPTPVAVHAPPSTPPWHDDLSAYRPLMQWR